MDNIPPQSDIKKLLEENLRLTKEVYGMVKKTRRYIALRTAMSILYLLIIIVPIILAVIYLPSLIEPYWRQYQEVLGAVSPVNGGAAVGGQLSPTDIFKILGQYQNGLNQ